MKILEKILLLCCAMPSLSLGNDLPGTVQTPYQFTTEAKVADALKAYEGSSPKNRPYELHGLAQLIEKDTYSAHNLEQDLKKIDNDRTKVEVAKLGLALGFMAASPVLWYAPAIAAMIATTPVRWPYPSYAENGLHFWSDEREFDDLALIGQGARNGLFIGTGAFKRYFNRHQPVVNQNERERAGTKGLIPMCLYNLYASAQMAEEDAKERKDVEAAILWHKERRERNKAVFEALSKEEETNQN